MNTSGTPSAPVPAAPRRRPWRNFFVGSALVVSGIIIGVGTSALSQGYGPRYGGSDEGGRYERYDGPGSLMRDHEGRQGWFEGRRGWFDRDRDGDRDGWRGRGRGFGGAFLSPGRIERMVDRLAWAVDASSEQKQKLTAIIQRAADDLRPVREKHQEGRRQIREVLTAPTIDRGKLETLRVDQMKLADQASQRITAALADAAEVLNPDQRATLARRLERFGPRGG